VSQGLVLRIKCGPSGSIELRREEQSREGRVLIDICEDEMDEGEVQVGLINPRDLFEHLGICRKAYFHI
jgi:hypothetical protein